MDDLVVSNDVDGTSRADKEVGVGGNEIARLGERADGYERASRAIGAHEDEAVVGRHEDRPAREALAEDAVEDRRRERAASIASGARMPALVLVAVRADRACPRLVAWRAYRCLCPSGDGWPDTRAGLAPPSDP